MLPARRLDQKPTKEELKVQEELLKQPPRFSGFGIPKEEVPMPKPEKPEKLDPEVKDWLNETQPKPVLPPPPPLHA